MTRVALMFPGQGSQTVGMADTLYDLPEAAPVLSAANAMGMDLAAALRGGGDSLVATDVAQPTLLFVESMLLASLAGLPNVVGVAGHSLGEYSALVAAKVLTASDAIGVVIERGRAMALARNGGMIALIGADDVTAEHICSEASTAGVLVVANFNAPGQVVLSGSPAALDAAERVARDADVRRVIRLNVGGAFHSPLMAEAAERFSMVLDKVPFAEPSVPVISNVDGAAVRDAAGVRSRLARQLIAPVRWADSVRTAVNELGAEMLIEVGPGTVLSGLAKRIVPGVETRSVATLAAARELIADFEVLTHG